MMKRITTPLLILGCVLVFAGIAVETLGFGNRYPADCPAQYRTPGGCLHSFSNSISLFGVNIYRTTVGNSAIIVGTILIVTALVAILLWKESPRAGCNSTRIGDC